MLELTKNDHRLFPDPRRLVARPFLPDGHNFGGDADRLDLIVGRILDLPNPDRARLLEEALTRSSGRHRDIESIWLKHFAMGAELIDRLHFVTDRPTCLLIGAYLTQAYAYEAAALTNPSIVPFGEPSGGAIAFVMSARAIGEGHISSIAFLTGTIDSSGELGFDPRHETVSNGERRPPVYNRTAFSLKLAELQFANEVSQHILSAAPEQFTPSDLDSILTTVKEVDFDPMLVTDTIRMVHWLAASNYAVEFDDRYPISEHLISPDAPAESHGMEDARFVRFVDDEGMVTYYATYTAFDGMRVLPQLIETKDFTTFRMSTMSGPTLYHKGMALFPRKIDGEFAALSRHDHETTFIIRSSSIGEWNNADAVLVPQHGWEAIQTGNCGSPLETDAGWLVITHGVGPMRRYVLGAILLDKDEPSKLIGRLPSPLLEPDGSESFGYVPDVVYSCGSMVHAGRLIIPYGCADHSIRVATVPVDQILSEMS